MPKRAVNANQQSATGGEGLDQQLQQDVTESYRQPLRTIERAVIILEIGIVTFPHDSQASGDGALADGEKRSGQQDRRVFPSGLENNG